MTQLTYLLNNYLLNTHSIELFWAIRIEKPREGHCHGGSYIQVDMAFLVIGSTNT